MLVSRWIIGWFQNFIISDRIYENPPLTYTMTKHAWFLLPNNGFINKLTNHHWHTAKTNQVCFCWDLFLRHVRCSDGLETAVAALNKQALGHRLVNYWLLLLSIDLATFYDVSSTRRLNLSPFGGLTPSHVYPHHYHVSPPSLTNQSYVSTCGIDETYLKW